MTQPTLEAEWQDPLTGARAATMPAVVPDDQGLTLTEAVVFLRRHFRLLMLSGLVAGLLAGLIFGAVLPARYEASATLILMPRNLTSELKAQTMSVQGFQRLLESDQVIVETRTRLAKEDIINAEMILGKGLTSKIYVSRREEDRPVAPVIELSAASSTPERAATIANAWAEVFLQTIHELQSGSTEANIQLVEGLYQESRQQVATLEEERLAREKSYRDEFVALQQDWNRKLSDARSEWENTLNDILKNSEALITEYQIETRQKMEALVAELGISLGDSSQTEAGLASTAFSGLDETFVSKIIQLVALRTQLAQNLEVLTLVKGISNDTIWQAALLEQTQDINGEELWASKLITEEVNSVFTELTLRTSNLESEIKSLCGNSRSEIYPVLSRLEELQRRRNVGLKNLYQERVRALAKAEDAKSRNLADLHLDRNRGLDTARRQSEISLEQIDRRLDNQKLLLNDMAKRYSQAALARGEQELADVRLGAKAMPPFEPRPRRLALKILVCAFFGSLIGVLVGLLRDTASG